MANIIMADVPSGGGYKLLASGTYTKTGSESTKLEIPAEVQGKVLQILIAAPELSELSETCRWNRYYNGNPETSQYANVHTSVFAYHSAGKTTLTWGSSTYGSAGQVTYSGGIITAQQRDNGYHVQNNTFLWYVWGEKT